MDLTPYVEIGRQLLAADASEASMRDAMSRHRMPLDFQSRAIAASRRLHQDKAERQLMAKFSLLTSDTLALLRALQAEATMAHTDAPMGSERAKWSERLASALEDAGEALDLYLAAEKDERRDAA